MVDQGECRLEFSSWRRESLALSWLLAAAALAGCDDGPIRTTLRNTGAACLHLPEDAVGDCSKREIPADVPLRVDVDFATCTSSSCDTVLNVGCRASRSGRLITVEAEAVIEREGDSCTDDCGFVRASCELGALPADTYHLVYGEESVSVNIPTRTADGCAGSGLTGRCCDTSGDCDGALCENGRCP